MDTTSLRKILQQAMQHQQAGEFAKAKLLYLKILESRPGNPDALHLFGLACHQQGDHKTAVHYIQQAVQRVPGQPVLRNNLGDALHKSGDLAGAIEQLQRALELRPGYASAHLNLSSVLAGTGDHEGALEHAREATRLEPQRAEAWFSLGVCLLDHVVLDESIRAFRTALALKPVYPEAAETLLYVLNMLPGASPVEVADEHYRVATGLFGHPPIKPLSPTRNERIRIGYVSGDFCSNAVNYFFEPVLEHHDKARFEIYCYSNVAQPDPITRRLRQLAHHWRDIAGLSDEAAAARIRSDGIDILVDLAGYTRYNRLGIFARKPARCQVSYLGYPNTTGLALMDYRVVDHYTIPVDEAPTGTEKPLRLDGVFACFRPPARAPAVQQPPVVSKGFVTFGCLHKLEKLNASVIGAWARVLQENPGSRLLLARDQLDDWHQNRLQNLFDGFGIDTCRLDMIHLDNWSESFFQLISRMDILLDVFPWSGHTIACCALWMGVPVISLQGNTHAGRMVASTLAILGLDELIAGDIESYIGIARGLCHDHDRLSVLRAGLRERMQDSPLCDEAGFTRIFESALATTLKPGSLPQAF